MSVTFFVISGTSVLQAVRDRRMMVGTTAQEFSEVGASLDLSHTHSKTAYYPSEIFC